jgi:hypothetical protein
MLLLKYPFWGSKKRCGGAEKGKNREKAQNMQKKYRQTQEVCVIIPQYSLGF